MSPIPGIIASQITGHLSTNSFESIQTVTVGSGGQSSISFSSIPSTYKHLQFRMSLKGTVASAALLVQYSGDTASNYNDHYLEANGSTVVAGYDATAAMIIYGTMAPTAATNVFSGGVLDVLDYTNSNKYKTSRTLSGYDANGSGTIDFDSGLWRSTSSISSALFYPTSGNFAQYSQISLYGIKG